jgi:hypothetical protein
LKALQTAIQRIDSDLNLVRSEIQKVPTATTASVAAADVAESSKSAKCQPTEILSVTPSKKNGALLASIVTPPDRWSAVADAVGCSTDDTKTARKRTREVCFVLCVDLCSLS